MDTKNIPNFDSSTLNELFRIENETVKKICDVCEDKKVNPFYAVQIFAMHLLKINAELFKDAKRNNNHE